MARPVRFLRCSITVFSLLGITLVVTYFLKGITHKFHRLSGFSLGKTIMPQEIHNRRGQDGKINGELTSHVWHTLCMKTISDIVTSPYFPEYPDVEYFPKKSQAYWTNRYYVQRIYGYVTPKETGYYRFALVSTGSSVLWLTHGRTLEDVTFIASNASRENSGLALSDETRSCSSDVFMKIGIQYPIDILHYQAILVSTVNIMWLRPGGARFETLAAEYISRDVNSKRFAKSFSEQFSEPKITTSDGKFSLVAFLTQWIWNAALPACDFQRTILRDTDYNFRYNKTGLITTLYRDGRGGDSWRDEVEVADVVQMYMDGLERVYQKKYLPKRIYNLEKFPVHQGHGSLFLFEIEMEVDGLDYNERVVDFIYKPNATFICYPKSLSWQRYATVNIIVVISDETKWIKLFINTLQSIYEETLEVDMNFIVVDFGGSGLDIEAVLEETSLDKHSVLTLNGTYSRSRGLNAGARLAIGHQPIILTYDVRLDIPEMIFEDTRKHCIARRMAFVPIAFQMGCGSHPGMQNPVGEWRYNGYEIIGIYKSDWDRTGGMDHDIFGRKGEYSFLKKISKAGLYTANMKYPNLYRHYQPDDDTLEL